jgi:hypothetical protein
MDTELNEDDKDLARWAVDAITRQRELEELREQEMAS